MGHELFVVARDRPDLYRYFVETFADAPTVQVLSDRRFGERRRTFIPVAIERRRDERRRRAIEAELRTKGHAFISLDESSSPIAR